MGAPTILNTFKGDSESAAYVLETLAERIRKHGGRVELQFGLTYPDCDSTCCECTGQPHGR